MLDRFFLAVFLRHGAVPPVESDLMTKSLHLAFVISHLGRGGAEGVVRTLVRGLVQRGHRVDLLTVDRREHPILDVPREVRVVRLNVHRAIRLRDRLRFAARLDPMMFVLLRGSQLVAARSVADYIRRERPDCILPSLSAAKLTVLLGSSLMEERPAIIPIMHNHVMNRRWDQRRLYSRLLPLADRIVAVSDGVAASVVHHLGISPSRVCRIYNPALRPEISILARQPPGHPWFEDGGPPVIVAVGRLVPVKDYFTLLRACRRLFAHRSARLVILGDGPERFSLERWVRRVGISHRVAFLGWKDNPFAFMSRAAVFVLSSRHEGLPSVLVESLACGCPSVSTDCPSGPAEVLGHGRFGELVPVGDEVALAAAIDRVLDAPLDGYTLRSAAQPYAQDAVLSQYEHLIADTLAVRRD